MQGWLLGLMLLATVALTVGRWRFGTRISATRRPAWPCGEYVFPNPATGRPYADLKPVERRLKKRAELSARPYDWYRHTFTTTALELGVTLDRVKRSVGHSIPDLTAGTYGHIRRDVLLAEADRVAQAIDAALSN